jgi:putative oxidoreductase
MLLDATFLIGFSLLLLRLVMAIIFFSSGKSHFQNPEERGESIGMSPGITRVLGVAEIIAAVSIALGIFAQVGAALIILTMLGALYMKIFVWKTGFYEDKGYGWHYDLLLLAGALIIFGTAGGYLVLH